MKYSSRRKRLRRKVRDMLPPLVVRNLYKAKVRLKGWPTEWEILPGGFEQARRDTKIKGWNESGVGDSYLDDLRAIREKIDAGLPFGVSAYDETIESSQMLWHNLPMTWGWALGRAAGQESQLSVLDWGGALGNYYVWARALRPDLTLDYTIKEMPLFAELGAQALPEVKFCDDAERALEQRYDLLLASCSLHYEEHWRELLPRLLKTARKFAFLTRVPLTDDPAFVYIQRPYAYGYETEYASWCFNRAEFIGVIEACGWQIEREVVTGERVEIKGVPEPIQYSGFLLRPRE